MEWLPPLPFSPRPTRMLSPQPPHTFREQLEPSHHTPPHPPPLSINNLTAPHGPWGGRAGAVDEDAWEVMMTMGVPEALEAGLWARYGVMVGGAEGLEDIEQVEGEEKICASLGAGVDASRRPEAERHLEPDHHRQEGVGPHSTNPVDSINNHRGLGRDRQRQGQGQREGVLMDASLDSGA
ncbi:unnamed protein product [Discosporangium mesarthrocarpum]